MARCPRKIATRLVRACAVGFVMIAFSSTARTIAQAGAPAQAAPATPSQGDHGKNEKVFGLSVIVKTESVSGDPVFHADGYRVRITTPGTASSFNGSLTSMADVTPGAWIRFEGTRDEAGFRPCEEAPFSEPPLWPAPRRTRPDASALATHRPCRAGRKAGCPP